jgi:hypothetical protein
LKPVDLLQGVLTGKDKKQGPTQNVWENYTYNLLLFLAAYALFVIAFWQTIAAIKWFILRDTHPSKLARVEKDYKHAFSGMMIH